MTAVTNGSTAYGENSETVVVGDNGVGSVRYITYSKTKFMWYYKFIKPENITSMYHRTQCQFADFCRGHFAYMFQTAHCI